MEVLFLAAIIFAFFMNLNLFARHSIIWVEGHKLTTKEKVVLVLLPGAKQLMPEEEFKKKMPKATVPSELFAKFQASFYTSPEDTAIKALGIE